jgi:hypothetical protein
VRGNDPRPSAQCCACAYNDGGGRSGGVRPLTCQGFGTREDLPLTAAGTGIKCCGRTGQVRARWRSALGVSALERGTDPLEGREPLSEADIGSRGQRLSSGPGLPDELRG